MLGVQEEGEEGGEASSELPRSLFPRKWTFTMLHELDKASTQTYLARLVLVLLLECCCDSDSPSCCSD